MLTSITPHKELSPATMPCWMDPRCSPPSRPSHDVGFAIQSVVLMGAAAISTGTPAATASQRTPSPESTSPIPSPEPSTAVVPGPNFSFRAPAFSPTNAVRVTGTKDAGSSVVITPGSPGGAAFCTIAASDDTDFGGTAAVASGPVITPTAVETRGGVASAPLSATIDVLGTPTIDGVPDSLTTGLVSGYGYGYAGSTVTTVLDSGAIGCSSVATDAGYWSCALSAPSGPYVVRANQSCADLGAGAASFPMIGAILAAASFAALSVAVWGWLRFVDPAAVEHRA